MKQNGTVQENVSKDATIPQTIEISSTSAQAILKDLSFDEAESLFIEHQQRSFCDYLIKAWLDKQISNNKIFLNDVLNYIPRSSTNSAEAIKSAAKVLRNAKSAYDSNYRKKVYSLHPLVIPGISLKSVIEKCEKELNCIINSPGLNADNIAGYLEWNLRPLNEEYEIVIKGAQEADDYMEVPKDFRNHKTHGITLKEYLIYALKYAREHKKEKKFLDQTGMTMCSGTSFNGLVPVVYYIDNKLKIDFRIYSQELEGKPRNVFEI